MSPFDGDLMQIPRRGVPMDMKGIGSDGLAGFPGIRMGTKASAREKILWIVKGF